MDTCKELEITASTLESNFDTENLISPMLLLLGLIVNALQSKLINS